MTVVAKPKLLCVDDEQRLIESLALLLRKEYDVKIASSGAAALQMLREMNDVAVVVSDFRMPEMDGATFLHEVMQLAPRATRILLTGEAGVEGAKDSVNKGQIFRFLTKPCPIDQLRVALEAGVAQHQLLNAERMVMQETLLECIAALMDVLAIVSPVAFGRANRIKRLVMEVAVRHGSGDFWQIEAAALLSQIGYLSVPAELIEKIYAGGTLTSGEQSLADGVPAVALRVLGHIPRLEPVMQILAAVNWTDEQLARLGERMVGLSARTLGLTLEYDALITRGLPQDEIVRVLRARERRYGAKLLDEFFATVSAQTAPLETLEVPIGDLQPGMTVLQEIRTRKGALLVPKGFEVTTGFLDRLHSIAPQLLGDIVRVSRGARMYGKN